MTATPKPSLSVRKYIKWGETFPTENTSTKVLTSPAPHNSFVDVRLLLVPLSQGPLPIQDLDKVDWAFAGHTLHRPADGGSPPHDVFKHWVDSRHADAEAVKDEGDFFPGPASGESLERGEMINPSTGQMEKYEECWIDGLAEAGGRTGWVLKWEGKVDGGAGGRGLMVKIGNVVQGVLRVGEDVAVGRWETDAEGNTKALAEVGSIKRFYLGAWGDLKQGENVEAEDGQTWSCVESW
ncbi:hypothetical protein BKA67DRAFT_569126 [Truncatella angustata]|uniref:Protein HRI1 n=1 Tax=Truncatella angustata TaxID=152316 RepID=A0A9P8ZXR7_9PEZI|nr:uncharacterized protein BKA67DRAFT_569126 [Truncatella angustata]KAH6653298.1 hypothetical protein BKA67DRAFT_569126 [Truncatella angustata]KAH8195136.1 hypothetical protein TruAng_010688 [Truncatella angustata]